jgi:hypothetical protein
MDEQLEPISLEEIRRQARENWRLLREQKNGVAKAVSHSKDAGLGAMEDRSHSIADGDID